ncbi:unnamed protein product [Notodromas monacha]|uniref:Uncharacterized protein n=1 Tax=Notodromas monacha TaxID=399045 RepID=A0A7R9BHC6_9CRUS|nr:unnamed protein product [Notodromas monacha]CAG0914820.1 unnamed protein product [Notodromas monacha]
MIGQVLQVVIRHPIVTGVVLGVASLSWSFSSIAVRAKTTAYFMNSGDKNSGTAFSFAFVTAPDESKAKELARGLVSEKLAACVNIVPKILSVYEWEGKINEDNEVLMMIKTRTNRVDELSAYIRKHHPYEVAEVIAATITQGNAPYLKWLGEVVPDVNKKL